MSVTSLKAASTTFFALSLECRLAPTLKTVRDGTQDGTCVALNAAESGLYWIPLVFHLMSFRPFLSPTVSYSLVYPLPHRTPAEI